jgi:Tfp pilus assembly protein PilP
MTTTAAKQTAPAKPASQAVPSTTSSKAASKLAAPAKATTTKAKATPSPKPAGPAKVKADIEAKVEKPAAGKATVKTAGRRDPFISPLRLQEDKVKGTTMCLTGPRCLIIDQVVLKGVIKTPQGMIAMVENAAKKQYNLREKDPVFNGRVERIVVSDPGSQTDDAVIFRETVMDNMGNPKTREVSKTLPREPIADVTRARTARR